MKKNIKINEIVISGIFGALIFFMIYGYKVINPMFDAYLLNPYIERDIFQAYSGWLFFRESPWTFPFGIALNSNYPHGMPVGLLDGIPIVSLFLKVFSSFLPEVFQFFGLYVLLMFVLQAVSSSLLIRLFTRNKLIIILGSVYFCLSIIMIERAFRHTAQSSHYLILFAMYLYFSFRKKGSTKLDYRFMVLNCLALLTHPYFIPMVFGLMFVHVLEYSIQTKNYKKAIIFFFYSLISLFFVAYLYMGTGMASGSFGYGVYSMNLNSIFNPISAFGLNWSLFINPLPQIGGNYDGFNYLGFGTIVFLILSIIILIKNMHNLNKIFLLKFFKDNFFIMGFLISIFIFAISNVITFNDKIIFSYALPDKVINFFSQFRSSGRLFYLVYYFIMLFVIIFVVKNFKKYSLFLIILLLFIQTMDIFKVLKAKYQFFNQSEIVEKSIYKQQPWHDILNNYKYVFTYGVWDFELNVYIAKHKLITNLFAGSRLFGNKIQSVTNNYPTSIIEVENSPININTIYIINNVAWAKKLSEKWGDKVQVTKQRCYYIFLPKKDNYILPQKNVYIFDKNSVSSGYKNEWENNGRAAFIKNKELVVIFVNEQYMHEALKNAKFLKSNNKVSKILKITEEGSTIVVYLDNIQYVDDFQCYNNIEIIK